RPWTRLPLSLQIADPSHVPGRSPAASVQLPSTAARTAGRDRLLPTRSSQAYSPLSAAERQVLVRGLLGGRYAGNTAMPPTSREAFLFGTILGTRCLCGFSRARSRADRPRVG